MLNALAVKVRPAVRCRDKVGPLTTGGSLAGLFVNLSLRKMTMKKEEKKTTTTTTKKKKRKKRRRKKKEQEEEDEKED